MSSETTANVKRVTAATFVEMRAKEAHRYADRIRLSDCTVSGQGGIDGILVRDQWLW